MERRKSNRDTRIRKLARVMDVASGQFVILMQITGAKIKVQLAVVRRINRNLAQVTCNKVQRGARPC